MHVVRAGPLVGQAVDEPGIRVEVEDDGPVVGKQGRPLGIRQAMRVLVVRDQLEQVDAVDAADLELGEMLQQQVDGGERLVRADVAARGHDEIWLLAAIGAELRPDADALGAVDDGVLHGQVLQVLLLVGHDDVDVVGRAQAVVGHGEETVAVGREVDADYLGWLVGDDVEEAGVLVREAVVVLTPDDGGEEDVEGCDLVAPFNL